MENSHRAGGTAAYQPRAGGRLSAYVHQLPVAVTLSQDIEHRPDRKLPYKARVRWTDAHTKRRCSVAQMHPTPESAQEWIDSLFAAAARGIDPAASTQTLAEYGNAHMTLALRGLEPKTTDPYLAGWKLRVVPALGHLPITMITNGAVDRTTYAWIADGEGRSTVKNTLAILVRVMEQAVRDGLITANPARIKGWQRQYQLAEDELDNPRALALRDWAALEKLATALVARSHDQYPGWGEAVVFAASTAARIGEVSGVRVKDIDLTHRIWTVRRQTTKGKTARRVLAAGNRPDTRLSTGPRGGHITTAVLRDATHWDEVVRVLGYDHLRRHDLRHTGLTWMADAGVPLHVLRLIAGHGSLQTTQRYLHPDLHSVLRAGHTLRNHLTATPGLPPPSPTLSATLGRL